MIKHLLRLVLAAVLLCGCSSSAYEKLKPMTITNSVDLTYEIADMSGYTMISEECAEYRRISMQESVRLFEEKGSGILYFGKDSCDYCQRAVGELNKVAVKAGVCVWYVDVSSHFTMAEYENVLKYVGETCPQEDGKPVFYAPEVLGIRNGEITGYHISLTKDFHLENKNTPLTDDQKKEMQDAYAAIFAATAD